MSNKCESDVGVRPYSGVESVFISDIDWDTDSEPHDLPQNIIMDLMWCYTVEEIEDLISDSLIEEYGFCHKGFSWRFTTETDN